MATAVLTLRVPQEIKERLDKLAQTTQRSESFLAVEALARYLDMETWQIGEIERAIAEADQGDFAKPADIASLLKKYAG